jgi:serine/threonine protein kinase
VSGSSVSGSSAASVSTSSSGRGVESALTKVKGGAVKETSVFPFDWNSKEQRENLATRWFLDGVMYFEEKIQCNECDFVDFKLNVIITRCSPLSKAFVDICMAYRSLKQQITEETIIRWINQTCHPSVLRTLIDKQPGCARIVFPCIPSMVSHLPIVRLEHALLSASKLLGKQLKALIFKMCCDIAGIECGLCRLSDSILIKTNYFMFVFDQDGAEQVTRDIEITQLPMNISPFTPVWNQPSLTLPKSLASHAQFAIVHEKATRAIQDKTDHACFQDVKLYNCVTNTIYNDKIFVKEFYVTKSQTLTRYAAKEIHLWLRLPPSPCRAPLLAYRLPAASVVEKEKEKEDQSAVSKTVNTVNGACLVFPARDLSLEQYLRGSKNQLSVAHRLFIFLQCINAVDFLHQQHIAHLDLKPANFMMNATQVEIIDLGHSQLFDDPRSKLVLREESTPFYQAPEQHLVPASFARHCCQKKVVPTLGANAGPRKLVIPGAFLAKGGTSDSEQTKEKEKEKEKVQTRGAELVASAAPLLGQDTLFCICHHSQCRECAHAHRNDGEKCDVYALGGVLFKLITGARPWTHEFTSTNATSKERNEFLFQNVVIAQKLPGFLPQTDLSAWPAPILLLLKQCLQFSPQSRPNLADVQLSVIRELAKMN